jgi:hypothetical protein
VIFPYPYHNVVVKPSNKQHALEPILTPLQRKEIDEREFEWKSILLTGFGGLRSVYCFDRGTLELSQRRSQ